MQVCGVEDWRHHVGSRFQPTSFVCGNRITSRDIARELHHVNEGGPRGRIFVWRGIQKDVCSWDVKR